MGGGGGGEMQVGRNVFFFKIHNMKKGYFLFFETAMTCIQNMTASNISVQMMSKINSNDEKHVHNG